MSDSIPQWVGIGEACLANPGTLQSKKEWDRIVKINIVKFLGLDVGKAQMVAWRPGGLEEAWRAKYGHQLGVKRRDFHKDREMFESVKRNVMYPPAALVQEKVKDNEHFLVVVLLVGYYGKHDKGGAMRLMHDTAVTYMDNPEEDYKIVSDLFNMLNDEMWRRLVQYHLGEDHRKAITQWIGKYFPQRSPVL